MNLDCTGAQHKTAVVLLVPAMTILEESHVAHLVAPVISEDVDRGLVEVLVRRCCEDPDKILSQVLA